MTTKLFSDDFYLTLSNDGSKIYYETNEPSNFQIKLNKPLNFSDGCWKVGLSSIQYNSTIDNISDEFIFTWDGTDYNKISLPIWCCTSIDKLINYINEKLNSFTCPFTKYDHTNLLTTKLNKIIPDFSLYDEFGLTKIPPHNQHNEAFCITHHIQPNRGQLPIRSRKRRSHPTPPPPRRPFDPNDFPEETDDSIYNNNQLKSASQTITFENEETEETEFDNHIPQRRAEDETKTDSENAKTPSRDLSTINAERNYEQNRKQAEEENEAEERKPVESFNNTIQNAINAYESFPTLTPIDKNDIQHKNVNYNITLSMNKLGNVEIKCKSPDYDIAFSNNLLNILGFEVTHPQLSIHNFKKRQFFRNYLHHYSAQSAFLFDKLFHALHKNDQILSKAAPDPPKYFEYIKHVIENILVINTENVWNDFSLNYNDQTLVPNWPLNSKWIKYFHPSEFFNFINNVDPHNPLPIFSTHPTYQNLTLSNRHETNITIPTKRRRGLAISYFMLHTLFKEQPLNNTISSTIPPHINHPNDIFLIYSDIIIPNLINETVLPLLAITQTKKDTVHNDIVKHEIINIQYRKCDTRPQIDTIQIYITSMTGKPVKFLRGPTFVELHFIRTPPSYSSI